jgi:tRNA(Ile2) C34 agmatinyltransferase TiaS
MKRIVRNSARCLECGEEVESKGIHGAQTCSCGNLMVDGGCEYLRRSTLDETLVAETSVWQAIPRE